jgi:hypothetical protein
MAYIQAESILLSTIFPHTFSSELLKAPDTGPGRQSRTGLERPPAWDLDTSTHA